MLEEYNYEKHECCKKEESKTRCCIDIILFILSTILAFTIDLIVRAGASIIIFIVLPAIIVLAIVLVILIIIRAIMLICGNKKC